MNTRKIVLTALFSAVALGIYVLESMIAPISAIPGVKLGLANVVTLVAVYTIGKRGAFATLIIRIALSSLLFGHMMSFFFSLAGGIACYGAVCVFQKLLDRSQMWALGIISAFAHNLGQIIVAIAITSQLAVAYYFLFMILASIITGAFTGVCAMYCVKILEKSKIL